MAAADLPLYQSEGRLLGFETGASVPPLRAVALKGSERISGLYEYTVTLVGEDAAIDANLLLGRPATVGIRVFGSEGGDDGQTQYRHVNGVVRRFQRVRRLSPRMVAYEAELVPWLWLLSQNSDYRLFRDSDLSGILLGNKGALTRHRQVAAMFPGGAVEGGNLGVMSPFERDYCVQYGESDFAFAARLMEDEGVSYYFRHQPASANANAMVLCAGKAPFPFCGSATLVLNGNDRGLGVVHEWREGGELRPGGWACLDYDFHGAAPVSDSQRTALRRQATTLRQYDYGASFARHEGALTVDHLQRLTAVRVEEQECGQAWAEGRGACAQVTPGLQVTMQSWGDEVASPGPWLVTWVEHEAHDWSGLPGGGEEAPTYANRFGCIPAATPFRPRRTTPKPVVHGVDYAVVVGDGGDGTPGNVDEHGRIRVRFLWDREDKDSCWVRLSQPSASGGWGSFAIPYVGDEVVVACQGGDPDRPLVVGRLYNGARMGPAANPYVTVHSDAAGNSRVTSAEPGKEFVLETGPGFVKHVGNIVAAAAPAAIGNQAGAFNLGAAWAPVLPGWEGGSVNGLDLVSDNTHLDASKDYMELHRENTRRTQELIGWQDKVEISEFKTGTETNGAKAWAEVNVAKVGAEANATKFNMEANALKVVGEFDIVRAARDQVRYEWKYIPRRKKYVEVSGGAEEKWVNDVLVDSNIVTQNAGTSYTITSPSIKSSSPGMIELCVSADAKVMLADAAAMRAVNEQLLQFIGPVNPAQYPDLAESVGVLKDEISGINAAVNPGIHINASSSQVAINAFDFQKIIEGSDYGKSASYTRRVDGPVEIKGAEIDVTSDSEVRVKGVIVKLG